MAATYYGVINYGGAYYKPTQFPQNGATSPPAYAGDLNYQAPNNLVAGTFTIFPTGGHATGVVNIAATGTGTIWTASNPFSVTVGSGFASISNYVNLSPISATFDLTLSSLGGTVTISDSTSATSQDYVAAAVVPNAPTGVTAVAATTTAVISFIESTDNGGSAITNHTATSTPGGLTGTSLLSPIFVAGLTIGVSYTFTVHSTNAIGNSPESAPSNAVIPPPIPVTGTDGGGLAPTKKEIEAARKKARLAREKEEATWDQAAKDKADLHQQIMATLHPEKILGTGKVEKPEEDDDEADIEMLLLYG